MSHRYRIRSTVLLVTIALLGITACDNVFGPQPEFSPRLDRNQCDLPQDFLLSIIDQDAIPSIDDPVFVDPDSPFAEYLAPDDRVIGVMVNEQAYAIPHNVLWHHEIVNFDSEIGPLAITYCPLTGSSIAFSRGDLGEVEFGVSGLLFQNNLVMYDRVDAQSVWVQMQGDAACGPAEGTDLIQWPVVEMRWQVWLALNPATRVLGEDQNMEIARTYSNDNYPYGDYEEFSNDQFLYPAAMPELDRRRPVKERVLGVPAKGRDRPIAFPFEALEGMEGSHQMVPFLHGGQDAFVLWDDEARGGMAFFPRTLSGVSVDLRPSADGFVDQATGSIFSVDGQGRSGPLEDTELMPIRNAYVAFWGAWAVFQEGTELWLPDAS